MQKKYWKEIVKSGEEDNFLKNVVEKANILERLNILNQLGILKEAIKCMEELAFEVKEKTTGEEVEIYIPKKDLLEYFKRS